MATRRAAQHKYCEGWINAQICEPVRKLVELYQWIKAND